MERINLLSGVLGSKQLKWEMEQHRKNREAEESHARKHIWGAKDDGNTDDVGDNIYLGDIQTHNHSSRSGSGGIAKTLAAAGLAAAGLGALATAPIIAWNLTRPDTQIVSPADPTIDTLNDVKPGFGTPEYVTQE